MQYLATKQAQANDFASALATASKITDYRKSEALSAIAAAQAQAKDFASALATASEITNYLDKYMYVYCHSVSSG